MSSTSSSNLSDKSKVTFPVRAARLSSNPQVSFGLPVWNAAKYLPRLFDSLLAQDFCDFEVVVSDNASDDRTPEICEEYIRLGLPLRYYRNSENIGQIPNFNRVLDLARGKYFRWIGSDDWLDASYTRKCVEQLDANPEIVGVTTYQDHVTDDGHRDYQEYNGERLDSPLPHVRFRRMVWFMTAHYGYIDPIYTMMRRDMLMATHKIQPVPRMDQVLSVEISLFGAFAHIPECLAHRRREYLSRSVTSEELSQRYQPGTTKNLVDPMLGVAEEFGRVVWTAPISMREKLLCMGAVIQFAWTRTGRRIFFQTRDFVRSVRRSLLLTRKKPTTPIVE
ncbi:MAG: glycosyltransferase family A protein [Cyanobacteriota bacterium]|nr:glycosyltransferase family A protein [Cyanobacteriota bacterium]